MPSTTGTNGPWAAARRTGSATIPPESVRTPGGTWHDRGVAITLAGRAENPTQARVLTLLRDEGSLSRVDLASRLGVSRTTIAAEVGGLVDLGLATDAGPAASRGGRRSTLVDIDPQLRFVGSMSARRLSTSPSPTAG